MAVTVRFKVDELTSRIDGGTIHLTPILSEEIPAGGIEIIFVNTDKFSIFKPGDEVDVVITPII
jgi:hypothetical protein